MLKDMLRGKAYEMGADLVGFGNVDRCVNAPPMMSPQGLYPKCQTIIVMAIKHPDACIDLGGEEHPQEIGPYSMQYLMNSYLDELSYKMAGFIEDQGYEAVPIASSNIWRYNQYKDLKAIFAPDLSHIYMSVVAGLADMGYNGLALTPEYGARNRFVTVLTNAVIEPDPLILPGTVCDNCMLCRKHCPSLALSKEIDGDKILKIEQHEYRFANKNLWRCAWGEHFDLDLDLEIPEKVDEAVILEAAAKHGVRGGEMGQCLKFCLPARVRSFDRSYSKSPVRRTHVSWNEDLEPRGVENKIAAYALQNGADNVFIWSRADLEKMGFDLNSLLPGAESAVGLALTNVYAKDKKGTRQHNHVFQQAGNFMINKLSYNLARRFEDMGFTSVVTATWGRSEHGQFRQELAEKAAEHLKYMPEDAHPGASGLNFNVVVTRKKLASRLPEEKKRVSPKIPQHKNLKQILVEQAHHLGADLVGITSAARLDAIIEQVRPDFDGEEELLAANKAHRWVAWDPEVSVNQRKLLNCSDHLPSAKSVIVLGLRLHKAVLDQIGKPPAEAAGPYAFQYYETTFLTRIIALKMAKLLERYGVNSVVSEDLSGSGYLAGNPRGLQPDLFSNRFAAMAAGLGYITYSGRVATAEFGLRQRFIAIVCDAELEESKVSDIIPEHSACATCDKRCIEACPVKAFTEKMIEFTCDGKTFSFRKTDRKLCDWSKRYTLTAEAGFKYLGSDVNEIPEPPVTPEKLADALKKLDPIKKHRPVVAEPCIMACPLAR